MSRRVSGVTAPRRCNSRARDTARRPRHTATLSASTPSSGEMTGRNGVRAREPDTGTTTTNSSSTPARISSADTMTAGRCLPGSPVRPAPKATSHNSPRRGSVNAVGCRVCPHPFFLADGVVARFGAGGLAFSSVDRFTIRPGSQLLQECGNRDTAFAGLGGQPVTRPERDPNCSRFCRHMCSLPHYLQRLRHARFDRVEFVPCSRASLVDIPGDRNHHL